MDTEGTIESVRINKVFVLSGLELKKVRAFFPQGQSKLSVIPSVASKRGHETKKTCPNRVPDIPVFAA